MIAQGDKDNDQKLSKSELTALADAWFDKLDPDKTGKLTQDQFVDKLGDVLPPPPGRREGGPPGGGRGFGPGRFIGPGLFAAADTNKHGSLTRAEWKATLVKWHGDWDAEKSGALGEEKLRDGLNAALPRPNFGGPGGPGGGFGPPPKPLTAEQVGLVRAWIDQGAK